MRTGLDVLLENPERLRGARLGVCCNHTAVDRRLDHLLDRLAAAGLPVRRIFTPEHGLHATAQDMVGIAGEGPELVSLYGDDAASLRPRPEHLADLDVVLFDIQDIGARYYTYQATLGYLMETAAGVGTKVLVLDRPNPIDGVSLEGNVVRPGFESFVSAWPLAVRHGMTIGELAIWFRDVSRIRADLEVVWAEGWDPGVCLDETDVPWVYPSPNMPSLETALLYPGLCLVEGTNLSEGRGTTRPFHLVGAPFFDARELCRLLRAGLVDNGVEGVAVRAATFEPRFQKFAGQPCHGVELTVTDRHRLDSFLLGLTVLEAARRAAPEHFRWRTATYEFVDEPIAIDLLCGSSDARLGLESRIRPRELVDGWAQELREWAEVRASCLHHPR